MAVADEGFSIGVLASRTGVTPTQLRTWENRYGFPSGQRSASGHRRFSEHDVELVREVLEVRSSGVPLQAAIEAVSRRREAVGAVDSVHAALVAQFPDLRPQRFGRRALVAASYAIEDEALARADRPVVLGAFQRGHNYDRSRHRWDELARTASWAAVLADFEGQPTGPAADPAASPARCQLPLDSPMRREWTVVTLSPARGAVLSAWEVPSRGRDTRTFEAVISTHRPVVLTAARALTGVAVAAGAQTPPQVDELLDEHLPQPAASSIDSDRTWLRALALLDPEA